MKNTLRFSTHLSYLKVFLSFLLVITMVTTSLPIAYADTANTNTANFLQNSDFDDSNANWSSTSDNINVKADGDGETATKALELKDGGNAVYQEVTQADGTEFIQGLGFHIVICPQPADGFAVDAALLPQAVGGETFFFH